MALGPVVQGRDVDIHRLRATPSNHIWVFGCFHIYLFIFPPFHLVFFFFFGLGPETKVLENFVFSIVFGCLAPFSTARPYKNPSSDGKDFLNWPHSRPVPGPRHPSWLLSAVQLPDPTPPNVRRQGE